jgi:hypothetical protein
MADSPAWPPYPVGPKDSVFALGVISANYAQLEFAVYAMFSTIMGLTSEVSSRIMYKIGPKMRDKLLREILPSREWPAEVSDLAQHFIEAHKICYENRNKLMHSNLHSMSRDAIILAKTGRDGKTTLANPLLSELQRVADDMKTYFDFGLHLSNMINLEILGLTGQAGDRWYESWPGKPPLPIPLEYTSDPRPIRRQR